MPDAENPVRLLSLSFRVLEKVGRPLHRSSATLTTSSCAAKRSSLELSVFTMRRCSRSECEKSASTRPTCLSISTLLSWPVHRMPEVASVRSPPLSCPKDDEPEVHRSRTSRHALPWPAKYPLLVPVSSRPSFVCDGTTDGTRYCGSSGDDSTSFLNRQSVDLLHFMTACDATLVPASSPAVVSGRGERKTSDRCEHGQLSK